MRSPYRFCLPSAFFFLLFVSSSLQAQVQTVINNDGDDTPGSFGAAITTINGSDAAGSISFDVTGRITLTQPLTVTQNTAILNNSPLIFSQAGLDAQILSSADFSTSNSVTFFLYGAYGIDGTDNSGNPGINGGNGTNGNNAALTAVSSTMGSSTDFVINGGVGGDGGDGGGGAGVTSGDGGNGGSVTLSVGSWVLGSFTDFTAIGGFGGDGGVTSFTGNCGNGGDVSVTLGTLNMNGSGFITLKGGAGDNGNGGFDGGSGGSVDFSAGGVTQLSGDVVDILGGTGGIGIGGACGTGGSANVTIGILSLGSSSDFDEYGGAGGTGFGTITGGTGGAAAFTAQSVTIDPNAELSVTGGTGGQGGAGGLSSGGNGGTGSDAGVTLGSLTMESDAVMTAQGGAGGEGGTGSSLGSNGNAGSLSVTIGTLAMNGGGLLILNGGGSQASTLVGGNGGNVDVSVGSATMGTADNVQISGGSTSGAIGGNANVTIGSMVMGASSNFSIAGGTFTAEGGQSGDASVTVNGLTLGSDASFDVIGGASTGNFNDVTMAAGSQISFSGTNTSVTVASLEGSGSIGYGSGNLQVTNGIFDGTITGGTFIESAGDFILDGAATLSGKASVSNGTFELGDSSAIGTLTAGSYSQSAGATLVMEVSPLQSSSVNVSGDAQLGGSLMVTVGAGDYDNSLRYRIVLLSAGSLTGTFASSDYYDVPSIVSPVLNYSSDAVTLSLYRNNVDFTSFAQTNNGLAVGTVLNQSVTYGTNALLTKLNELYFLPSGQAPLLDQLGGVIYTSIPNVLLDNLQFEDDLLFSRLDSNGGGPGNLQTSMVGGMISSEVSGPAGNAAPLGSVPASGFWLENTDSFGSVNATAQMTGFNKSNVGFLGGYDGNLSPGFTAGVMGGYLHTTVTSSDTTAQAGVDGYQFGVYGRKGFGNLDISLVGGYTIDRFQVDRNITLGSDVNALEGTYNGSQISGALRVGYRLTDVDTTITPFAGLEYAHLSQDGFTETGSTSLNLSMAAQSYDSLRPYMGLGETWKLKMGGDVQLIPAVSAMASEEVMDTSATQITTDFGGATSDPFTVSGVVPDGTVFGVSGGAQLLFGKNFDLFASYNGHFSGTQSLNTINGGASLAF